LDVQLDTAWVVLSGLEDTLLSFPRHAVRGPDGTVFVTDRGTKVVAFDTLGTVRWSDGRPGQGPEEFENINDIRLHDDLLYLPDLGNNRIAVLSTEGEFQRYITPPLSMTLWQIAPLEDGRIVVLTLTPVEGGNIVILNSDGTLSAIEQVPLDGHDDLPLVLAQAGLAQDGDQWVLGYSLGDGWAMFDGASPTGVTSRYVERVPTPEVIQGEGGVSGLASPENAVCTACSLALNDSVVFVLFGGRTGENRAQVDLHDVADGEYLGSFLLPDRAYGITVRDGQLVMLMLAPVPHVVALDFALPSLSDLRANR
jgi:hypothetical protein